MPSCLTTCMGRRLMDPSFRELPPSLPPSLPPYLRPPVDVRVPREQSHSIRSKLTAEIGVFLIREGLEGGGVVHSQVQGECVVDG